MHCLNFTGHLANFVISVSFSPLHLALGYCQCCILISKHFFSSVLLFILSLYIFIMFVYFSVQFLTWIPRNLGPNTLSVVCYELNSHLCNQNNSSREPSLGKIGRLSLQWFSPESLRNLLVKGYFTCVNVVVSAMVVALLTHRHCAVQIGFCWLSSEAWIMFSCFVSCLGNFVQITEVMYFGSVHLLSSSEDCGQIVNPILAQFGFFTSHI